MKDIKGLTLEELKQVLVKWNEVPFHAQQIFAWIYKKGIDDFSQMSDLALDLRKQLKENFYIFDLKLIKILRSRDGTKKFLLKLRDKNFIEAVTIPTERRLTGCISTQVGCRFGCRFCASGASGFRRNLNTGEMLGEILYLKNNSLDRPSPCAQGRDKRLTHIVFMGVGEPLDNYDNVIKIIRIINSTYSFNIAARRITISTCGIIPAIKRLAGEGLQVELSVSLHAVDDRTRSYLMPINKKHPLQELITTCREYIKKTKRQITFEYVLIKDINSDLQSAQKLSKILKDLDCKINIIPCNLVRVLKVRPPNKMEILLFRNYLLKSGINVTLRKPRGQDIEAACGQLRLRYEKI